MLITPPWTLFNLIFYLGFVLGGILFVYSDYHGRWTLQYSKFANAGGIPSRIAMFILYFVPVLTATAAVWPYLFTANGIQLVVYLAITVHFVKRVLETLFLHKYSGTMSLQTLFIVTVFYSFIAGMISLLSLQTMPAVDGWFYSGLLLYLVGEAGNFYHHKLLADLRNESEGYHIPRGGLFEYVACPHYFFEIIVWLAIFLIFRHLFALVALIVMAAYLIERSLKTRRWYQEKFPEYPKDRKCIVPFVL